MDCKARFGEGTEWGQSKFALTPFDSMKNTTLGLLLKTYVVMASGYYLPSSVRMLVNKITIEFS
jgi:hypothetical protein